MPRMARKQTHRVNHPVTSVEEFFKVTIIIPYLDSVISSLNDRFSDENISGILLYNLHPKNLLKLSDTEFINSTEQTSHLYKIDNFKEQSSTWFGYISAKIKST